MGLFFKIIGAIFLLFLALVVGGYFASPTLTVEREIYIDAPAEDIFPYLNDLELFAQWSPWTAGRPDASYVYGEAIDGVGASVMWRSSDADDAAISSQEIISSQAPEFVQSALLLNAEPASVTYALLPDESGRRVGVFIQFEKDVGGFPYMQRLLKGGDETALGRDFDAALLRLKTIVEAG
ncbi:SRPBCC family protein [Fretibacter rubidus]|uniref:SRPBCC family protein n=1 Tax=Fretibacter rubidus TaxID=570162 RepID=UPI00352A7D79